MFVECGNERIFGNRKSESQVVTCKGAMMKMQKRYCKLF